MIIINNFTKLLIGSQAPSGVLQVFDLDSRLILEVYNTELEFNNVEDFS
jgi:hypothetical protein